MNFLFTDSQIVKASYGKNNTCFWTFLNQWFRVTLAATPVSGKTFAGWTCSAHCDSNSFTTSLPIDVVLDNDTIDISASFN